MTFTKPDCPKCHAHRKIAHDYKTFNDTLKEQCAKQAADLKELRRRLSVIRKALVDSETQIS
jgi:hypothetical protein